MMVKMKLQAVSLNRLCYLLLFFCFVESTSLLGNGSMFPTIGATDSSVPMIYGVFTTPQ